jgi:undecaprenyl-diphosphatase
MGQLQLLNTEWYLDVNHFARSTSWLHPEMAQYAHFVGVGILALLLLIAWWQARSVSVTDLALVFWAGIGTVLAWAVAHYGLKPLIAERRPYLRLHHVEVLLTRTHGYSFPSGHATVAGAVLTGLWLTRHKIIATLATIFGLLLAYSRVYTGMHYPGDVVAGLIFGALFILLLAKPAKMLLAALIDMFLKTPLSPLLTSTPKKRYAHSASN